MLTKTLSLSKVDLKFDGDTGKFAGYASVFGGLDSYGDTIVKGAFEETLRARGLPKMFYNHDWHMPVGKYANVFEDDIGLRVEGELTPGLSLASDVRAAMRHGTIEGLSIGGFIKRGDYDETEAGRTIRKWSHLVEVSPVVFAADGAARIDPDSIKTAGFNDMLDEIARVSTVREFEQFLRDAGAFTKGQVTALTARAKHVFAQRDAGEDAAAQMKAIAARLKKMAG
jgi:hypothetical protein